MIKYYTLQNCVECGKNLDTRVFEYSKQHFGHPLCRTCQDWFRGILKNSTATNEAISLYFALKVRGVPAKLEKFDGFKTIDIAVPHAKVNIEVDGGQHLFNFNQAMSDLKRTLLSYKQGYSTLRIPNLLAKNDLEQTADLITEFLIESRTHNSKNTKS